VIDGKEVPNDVLKTYVEDMKCFARNKRGNTSYQTVYSTKRQSCVIPETKKKSSIVEQAEKQRISRLKQRINAVPLNVIHLYIINRKTQK